MSPRTYDQVYASLGNVYDPQAQSIQAQQAQLPQQLQNDESALQGQQTQAFDNIFQGARRRGTGVAFGGIPLGEQANYTATTFLPAMANLRSTYAQKGTSLQDAILGIQERRQQAAQGTFENERNFYEQQRQFNEQQAASARAAAAASSYSPTFGGGGGGATPTAGGGGAKFIGNNDLRGHLNYLASKENNQDAAVALKYVGNDGKYSLSPYVTNPAIIAALNRMGAVNVFKASTGAPAANRYGGSTTGLNAMLGR